MKKESGKSYFSLMSFGFGLASLIVSITQPILGIIFGVVGLVMNSKQKSISDDDWNRAGRTLSVVGIVVGIIASILIALAVGFVSNNPGLFGGVQ